MNIVLIAYHFTPSTMVGSLRARGLAQHLHELGHDITVITAEPDPERSTSWDVISVPHRTFASRVRRCLGVSDHHTVHDALGGNRNRLTSRSLAFLRRAAEEVLFWPDQAAAWGRAARKLLDAKVRRGEANLVLSTSPPVSSHVALLRSGGPGIPWVADFRDLWTEAHHYPYSAARRWVERRTEDRIARTAQIITCATTGFTQLMRIAHPDAHVVTVYNGFDPALLSALREREPNPRFTVVHAGNLYGGRVDPSVFFKALCTLFDHYSIPRSSVAVEFFTARESWLLDMVDAHDLSDVVAIHGIRPRDEVHAALSRADVLLLLQWDHPGEAAVLPAKTLEYLASRRFILSIGSPPGGEVDRLLRRTGAGCRCNDVDSAAALLKSLWEEHAAHGFVRDRTNELERARWSQQAMALAMADAIGAAVSRWRERASSTPARPCVARERGGHEERAPHGSE